MNSWSQDGIFIRWTDSMGAYRGGKNIPTGRWSARQAKILMLYTIRAIMYLMTFVFLVSNTVNEHLCYLTFLPERVQSQFALGHIYLLKISGEAKDATLHSTQKGWGTGDCNTWSGCASLVSCQARDKNLPDSFTCSVKTGKLINTKGFRAVKLMGSVKIF